MHSEFTPTYDYKSFELLVGAGPDGSYSVSVIKSPAGADAADACWLDPNDFSLQEFLIALQVKDVDGEFLEQIGSKLFEELFTDKVEQLYRSSLTTVRNQGKNLRIHLRIETPELAVLPWEYLFDGKEDRFLALSPDTAVVRHIPMPVSIRSLDVTPPLRVLAVFTNPAGMPALDIDREKTNLRQALAKPVESGQVKLEILENGTMASIGEAMRTFHPHVFHFVGHGLFADEKAYLILEDAQGEGITVDERAFSELFEGCQETRLVVLNACETGTTSVVQPLAGMAPRLLRRQICAVLAMQAEILDDAAVIFSRVFYRSLAAGYPVDAATAEARRAISQEMGQDNSEWGVPVLFLRAQHGHLFNFTEASPLPPRSMQPPNPTGFVGREAELAYFTRQLKSNRIAVISGTAGVGKTVLAATLVRRLAGESQIFWHAFYKNEGMDVVVRKLAGWLAEQGQNDLWRRLQNAGEIPRTEMLFDHLFQLLTGHGYLICLDDLHYVDDDPLLEQLVDRLRSGVEAGDLSLIVTTNHLPPSFFQAVDFEPLAGLTLEDTQNLLAERNIALADDQTNALHRTTEGNPEFLNLATNLLQDNADSAQLIERLGEVKDIEQHLLEKVDAGLTDLERAVMRAVSVLLGYPGSLDIVDMVLGYPDTSDAAAGAPDIARDLYDTLAELSRRLLLVTGDDAYDRTYSQHAIVQTFYYKSLSRRQRKPMHRRAAEYYESEEVDLLKAARHYGQAGEYEHAATLAVENVAALINRGEASALRQLLVYLSTRRLPAEKELQLLEARGDIEYLLGDLKQAAQTFGASAAKASDALTRARLRRKLGEVQARLGEYHKALATFRQGREQIRAVAEAGAEDAQFAVGIATVLLNQGQYDEALAQAETALDALDQQEFPRSAADLYDVEGKVYYHKRDFSAALTQFQAALDLRQDQQDQRLILKSYSNLAIVYGYQNRYTESVKANKTALEIAEQIGDLVAISALYRNIAADYADLGQYEQAIDFNTRSLSLAEKMGAEQSRTHAHYNLGEAYRNQGDFDQATQHLVCAIGLAGSLGDRHALIGARRELAEVYLQEDRIERAYRECLQALQLGDESGTQFWRPQILATLGEVQHRRHQWSEARATFVEALQLLEEGGGNAGRVTLLLNWSQLEEDNGNLMRAYELCLEAEKFVDQADGNGWVDQVNTRIKRLQAETKSGGHHE